MKKILPCSFKTKLLTLMFFVAFMLTNTLSAQVCLSSQTFNPNNPTQLANTVCAGDNLLWTTTSVGSSAGLGITWSLVDGTSGAFFVASGTNTYHTTVNAGTPNINSVLVHMGPHEGSVTVSMQFDINPNPNTCASSGISKIVEVNGTPSIQKCAQDTGTITATGITHFGFPIGDVNTHNYTFTLNPGGITNTTGVFSGLAPGPYTIHMTDPDGCADDSPTITLVNPPVIPVHATCPGNVSVNSCFYLTDADANTAYINWLNQVGFSGGTGTVTPTLTITPPNPVISACGTNVHIVYSVVDECGQKDSCQADFVITPYVPVVTAQPLDRDIKYCDLANLNLADEFANFLKAFKIVSGGCSPTLTPVAHGDPSLCGGEPIVVTFILHDKCAVDKPLTATFTVEKPLAPHIDTASDVFVPVCASQADIDTAWNLFLGSIHANNECGPLVVNHGTPDEPKACTGGDVPVTFTANPNCFPPLQTTATFHVPPSPAPVINNCPAARDLKCNPVLPPAVDPLDYTSVCPAKVTTTDGPIQGDACSKSMVRTYKVTTDCFPNGVTCQQTFTWSTDTGIKDLKCPDGGVLDCNIPNGIPAATNPTFTSDCPATITHVDNPITGDDCHKTFKRTYKVATACFPDGITCDQIFTWKSDLTKPVITKTATGPTDLGCNPTDAQIEGALGGATALDNCDGDITKLIVTTTADKVNTHDCFFSKTRTWNVKDECGNIADTQTRTITWKEDLIAPIITGTEHTTIPGGFENNGLCTPTTTVGGPSFTPPAFKGSSNVSVDFGQIRTGDAPDEILKWTNGTTTAQSDYFEGMGVPQRILLQGLKKGKHSLYIRHEAIKKQDDSRHAYDFLMSWDQAIATSANIGPDSRVELKNLNTQECDGNWSGAGQTICQGMTTSAVADIPDTMGNPPNQTGIANVDDVIKCFEGEYGNRTMQFEGTSAISGQSVTFLGYAGDSSKSDYAWYRIDWTSDSPNVEIKFAGRMAQGGGSCGYGNCWGAGSIHGNPYHIILEGLDGAGVGQRDNQTKCKPALTCDVNIPVHFKTPTATDCDPKTVQVFTDGNETIVTNPDGSVTHCQKWIATDACGNVAHDESCITVVCAQGANFGDLKGTIKVTSPTAKTVGAVTPTNTGTFTNAVGYPNPFRSHFNLDVTTTSVEPLNVSVYDMLGKSIDQRSLKVDEVPDVKFGNDYPTGIYNVILNQATEVKTVRMIKQ